LFNIHLVKLVISNLAGFVVDFGDRYLVNKLDVWLTDKGMSGLCPWVIVLMCTLKMAVCWLENMVTWMCIDYRDL